MIFGLLQKVVIISDEHGFFINYYVILMKWGKIFFLLLVYLVYSSMKYCQHTQIDTYDMIRGKKFVLQSSKIPIFRQIIET